MHSVARCKAAAHRLHPGQPRGAIGDPRRGQPIFEPGRGKGPIEQQRHLHRLSIQTIEQQFGLAHPAIDPHRAEPVLPQIRAARGIKLHRVRYRAEPAIPAAIGKAAIGIHRDAICAEPGQCAACNHPRPHPARCAIAAIARGECQPGERCPLTIRQQGPAPIGPIARPANDAGNTAINAGERRQNPAAGRDNICIHIKLLGIGHGDQIKLYAVPGTCTCTRRTAIDHPRIERDNRRSAANIGAARGGGGARWPGNPLRNAQPPDAQPFDQNIEIGQDRFIVRRLVKVRHAQPAGAIHIQIMDGQPVAPQIVKGLPIQPRFGHFEEQSLRIIDPHIAQHRVAEQRSFDAANPDFEAAFGRDILYPVGNKSPPDAAFQQQSRGPGDEDQRNRQPEQPAHGEPPQPARPAERARLGRISDGAIIRH